MHSSFSALCTDFYVNQKLSVKLELPQSRDTVLDMFERLRREFSHLDQFRRYNDELALETADGAAPHRWVAVRETNIRSGVVNPSDDEEAYSLHRHVLEVSPYFLSISPLDIDFVELLFGFDLECRGGHDRVIHEALIAPTALGDLIDVIEDATPIDCQPVLGYSFGSDPEFEVHVEVKSRNPRAEANGLPAEPISVYLTVRRLGPVDSIGGLRDLTDCLSRHGEAIVESCVVPKLLRPLRESIGLAGS